MSGRFSRPGTNRAPISTGSTESVVDRRTSERRHHAADGGGLKPRPDASRPPKKGKKLQDYNSLAAEAFESVVDDGERVRAAFVNPEGATVVRDGQRRRLSSTVGMLVSDRRVAFVTPTLAEGTNGSLEYGDIASISLEDGDETTVECSPDDGDETTVECLTVDSDETTVQCSTVDGNVWQFVLPAANPDVVDSVGRHLRWIGAVRPRVVQFSEEVETVADRIREHATAREWDRAQNRYERARTRLDHLTCAVQLTDPIADHVLAPELTEVERVLEDAHVRLFIERSTAKLDDARKHIESEEYDRAQPLLEQAQSLYRLAGGQSDAVRRGDDFQFGTQRELDAALQRLGWEIETVAAEPLRQAVEARIRAESSSRRSDADSHRTVEADGSRVDELEWWETAFRRFDKLHAIGPVDGPHSIVGDVRQVTRERESACKRLYTLHSRRGRKAWKTAATSDSDGERETALHYYTAAASHLKRAHELASECDISSGDESCGELSSTFDSDEFQSTPILDTVGLPEDPLSVVDTGWEDGTEFEVREHLGEDTSVDGGPEAIRL